MAVFSVLSMSILGLQQKIVDISNETRTAVVPKLLVQIRSVRNLEMLRQFGAITVQSDDQSVRQEASLYASFAAAYPSTHTDESTQALVNEASKYIQGVADQNQDKGNWLEIDRKLAAKADQLAVDAGIIILERAKYVETSALEVRNVSIGMTMLFVVCILFMLALERWSAFQIKLKNKFFSEASHDFRQRIHSMQLMINAAQRTPISSAPAFFSKIISVTSELQRYLDNFLELARLQSVETKVSHESFDVQSVFQQLEIQFEDLADSKGVVIKFRFTPAKVISDERLLMRILENIISNAIKFSSGKVLVAAKNYNNRTEIWICDNGLGMPDSEDSSLLGEFVQGRNSRQIGHFEQGFGLGLSIVMRLAELLSAKIEIYSRNGAGSLGPVRKLTEAIC